MVSGCDVFICPSPRPFPITQREISGRGELLDPLYSLKQSCAISHHKLATRATSGPHFLLVLSSRQKILCAEHSQRVALFNLYCICSAITNEATGVYFTILRDPDLIGVVNTAWIINLDAMYGSIKPAQLLLFPMRISLISSFTSYNATQGILVSTDETSSMLNPRKSTTLTSTDKAPPDFFERWGTRSDHATTNTLDSAS
ncbi:hypothetical protein BS47DRAFT_955662 [Hydnum rufescens UP504]|uniref:Uncharacterized protein n=1 Tax=Hydnum rufescens UP504 TaxID=1448309 RepID=A0A9P6AX48_9AGAM|nr:hypothetical protein BS47DRAFT_955662 [Hydnum rufescens UP504]